MNAVILDDEYYACEGLKLELESLGIEVLAMFEDGCSLLNQIDELQPDILFLDIEMPNLNGFEIISMLSEKNLSTAVIFVTAFTHYAIDAFDTNAFDYLVKPVESSRLLRAINRVQSNKSPSKATKLSVQCFGYFSVSLNDNNLSRIWKTKKVEELFAYLVCARGNYVSKERIGEAIWPEQTKDKYRSNFYTAQFYLKKHFNEIGLNDFLEVKREKIRLSPSIMDCDIYQFDDIISSTNRNIPILEHALTLYKGTLFEDKCYEWVNDLQRYYEVEFDKLIHQLFSLYSDEKNFKKIEYLQKKYYSFFE